MKKLFGFILLLSVLAPAPAWAIVDNLNLSQVLDIALKNNPKMREAEANIDVSDASISLATSKLFPNVSGVVDGGTNKDPVNTSSARFSGDPFNLYTANVTFSQPVLAWGLISGIQSPKRAKSIAEVDQELTVRSLSSDVIRAFYKLLLNERLLVMLRYSESTEKESLVTGNHRFSQGRIQLLDVLQIKTQLALLVPKIAQAQNNMVLASAELANLMGEENAKELHVNGKLEIIPFEQIRKQISFEKLELPEIRRSHLSLAKLAADREVTLGTEYPRLDAKGNWGRSGFQKSDLADGDGTGWYLGLEVTIPLFSGLSSSAERHSFAAQKAQLDWAEQTLQNQLALAQIESLKNLQVAQENIASSRQAFDLADASLKEARKDFVLAITDFLHYLTVQQSYLDAANAWDQAKYQYINSLVDYFVASGQPLDKLVQMLQGAST